MKRKYIVTAKEARKFNKYGIDLVVYGENVPEANVVHVSVKKGHFEEFYVLKSYFIYYIVKGKGTFYDFSFRAWNFCCSSSCSFGCFFYLETSF